MTATDQQPSQPHQPPAASTTPAEGSRYAGPVVFVILAAVVGSVGAYIWLSSKIERPETKPAVSRTLEPYDWSWARTVEDDAEPSTGG